MISTEQQAIVDAVAQRSEHILVEATAGSGKTTTLVHIANALPSDVTACFLAFNRSAARELGKRLPEGLYSTTLHALGLRIIKQAAGRSVIRPAKQSELALSIIREALDWNGDLASSSAQYLASVVDILRTERASVETVFDYLDAYSITPPVGGGDLDALHALLRPVLLRGKAEASKGIVDYTDLLYQPVALGATAPFFNLVCVDEAQDLSPASFALTQMLLQPGTKAVFVGDPHQAIYGFAGAESGMMDRLAEQLPARKLPLSVSFRCPTRHVLLARGFSHNMSTKPGASTGEVHAVTPVQFVRRAQPGSLVLARRNAELIEPFLALLKRGVPVHVLGIPARRWAKRIVSQLAALPSGTIRQRIERFDAEESRRLEREHVLSPELGRKLTEHAQDVELAWSLAHGTQRVLGDVTIDSLNEFIQTVFRSQQHSVLFSTIHKAKGREANHVYVLNPEWFHVANEEEANLLFVALTRAKESFTLVSRRPTRMVAALPQSETEGDAVWRGVLSLCETFAKSSRHTWREVVAGVLSPYERSRRIQSSGREARGGRSHDHEQRHHGSVH